MQKQPNIVYFVADQLRSDAIAHHGNAASITPNIDKILEEGVSFENAFCQNPVCVPSRASFLTGLYPHTTGHRTIHYLQNEGEPNFLRTMKQNGYEVIWVGRNDIIPGNRTKDEFCDMYFDGVHNTDMKSFTKDKTSFAHGKSKDTVDPSVPGYYSFFVGKLEEEAVKPGTMWGFDWQCLKSALEYIDTRDAENSKPFFLYVTLQFPHPPYGCEEPWFSSIDRSKISPRRPNAASIGKPSMLKEIAEKQNHDAWGEENMLELRATYLAMVSRFDYQYGLLRDKLIEKNLYDDTSIFLFSDHGDYTSDYSIAEKVQNCFEDPITNVPLVIKPAAQFNCKPRITKAMAELVDLTQTVCDMAQIKTEYVNFGKSLLPVLEGHDDHRDVVFSEGGRIHGEVWAMERGHGPESPYWPRLSTQCEEGPQHTKAVMIRSENLKYVYRLYEDDELYDLTTDPLELVNVISDPSYAEAITQFKLRMLDWFVETGDIVPDRKDIR